MTCTCQIQQKWADESTESSSSPSTCVLCSEDRSLVNKESKGKFTKGSRKRSTSRCDNFDARTSITKSVDSTIYSTKYNRSDKNVDMIKSDNSYTETGISKSFDAPSQKDYATSKKSDTTEVKSTLFNADEDTTEETDKLIQLRNVDYKDIVDDNLKIALALLGYPKSKMRLQQIENFQRSLKDILDMQLREGLLHKMPVFLDYYLNRGAIVCICKDFESRDWLVRVVAGLQDRMNNSLVLLKTKVKRLCLGVTKIPRTCWPASAQDTFKLLQYFNPKLRTYTWKIYSQNVTDNVEHTCFIIDNISGEIIRGSTFKNVIDYSQMDFELTGFTEIYYDNFLTDMEEHLSSVGSRVKLLQEIRSTDTTPRISPANNKTSEGYNESAKYKIVNLAKEMKDQFPEKDTQYQRVDKSDEIIENQSKSNDGESEIRAHDVNKNINQDKIISGNMVIYEPTTSAVAVSDRSVSITESSDNLIVDRNSYLNIDSNRGIAYHRRTNYLQVENELKIAIVLEGYPHNKLEGTHIRRLKHLLKEYLHKDMKMQRFTNLIIPKFQDIYLSNGAVIYICDSIETKDYLTEVLPKLIKSTGLKLIFRDIKDLLRYTRIIMRLPKEISHAESLEILLKLKESYPGLNPDRWKYYSDVAGKQKRQFGVDPESLEIIKSCNFDPSFEGKKLDFRIINRQKRDRSFEDCNTIAEGVVENVEDKKKYEKLLKNMYCSIEPDIMNATLARIRTNHYSDLVADDLKLYLGPSNYPENRIDEALFYSIKRCLELIVLGTWNSDSKSFVPKLNDIYLFDGVIFVICKDFSSREWIENNVTILNQKLHMNLKATEFRGAVGIISMLVNTNKNTEDVVAILQNQNPRLRTKYWRIISCVQTSDKLDVVLQIDKLSAQVITHKNFNDRIGDSAVQFKLGHLKSLLNPKLDLEEINKEQTQNQITKSSPAVLKARDSNIIEAFEKNIGDSMHISPKERSKAKVDEHKAYLYKGTNSDYDKTFDLENPKDYCKVVLKVPSNILPNSKNLDIVFELLEDQNPGLNTELWIVKGKSPHNKGKFILEIDKNSASIINGENFDATLGGEKLKFKF